MEPAPFFADVAGAPAGGGAWWVAAGDGVRIRVAAWPREGAKGTVLLLPGRTEYVEKYGAAAGIFADAGFAMLTVDWRGQGLADRALGNRRLGHVGSFAEYQRDLAGAMNLAGWLGLPEPHFLIGHSMGGCIGLRALHAGLKVRAAVFSSPMWGIRMAPWERPLAWSTALIGPLLGLSGRPSPRTEPEHTLFGHPFEGNDLTTDRARWGLMKRQYEAHPELILGPPTIGWLRAALIETARLARLPAPSVPALAFLAGDERIVEPAAIERQMARWQGGRLERAERAEHEIMMERDEVRDRFFEQAIALFEAQIG